MTQLQHDIRHLEANLKQWRSSPDDEGLARTRRLLSYLKELEQMRTMAKGGEH